MWQIQPRLSMQAVEEALRMWAGLESVLNTEDLLHPFSIPGADWSRILGRIYLRAF